MHLPEWLKGFDRAYVMFTSALLLIVLYMAPSGLAGLVGRIVREPQNPRVKDPVLPETARNIALTPMIFPSETPMLSVSSLTKTFGGIHALEDVSFSLMRGSITAIIGPNGSGKSTLINCITGVYSPDHGDVVIGGRVFSGDDKTR